jgi:hypothetical protein
MHKHSRNIAKALTALLLTAALLSGINPSLGSSGNIHINSQTSPSPNVSIELGVDLLNLSFNDVVWSGGTVLLYLSADGWASVSDQDTSYGPMFQVAAIQSGSITTVNGYSVGNNWINGTVPVGLGVPGGAYYVKAYDGDTAAVAVTDTTFTIVATFEVVPTWGPGQTAIVLKGYALPANDFANFSWSCTSPSGSGTIATLVPADGVGYVEYSTIAPDLLQAGDNTTTSTIVFQMVVDGTAQTLTANFIEYYRGLKQVQGVTGVMAGVDTPPNTLYDNNTDLSTYEVNVTVLGDLIIAGYYFHPGALDFLWDGSNLRGTATASSTNGFFNTTISVPITSIGQHNVTIDDGKSIFVVWVNVIPTLILDPTEGPVGTTVTATGYGFPASTSSVLINVTLSWDYVDACSPSSVILGYITTNTNGQFVTTFVVPSTVGGTHTVTATANDTASTTGTATFTVIATLSVSPSIAANNGTVVTVSGTGLGYGEGEWYDLWINGKDWYSADYMGWTVYFNGDCVGDFSLELIIDASYDPGTYAVILYKLHEIYELPEIEAYVMFTVVGETGIEVILDEITDMLTDLHDFVTTDAYDLLMDIQDAISDAQSALEADVAGVASQLTSIATSASTAATRADAAATSAANAATYAQSAETAAEAAQSATSGISMAVYGAIILALIAALASIFAVITLQRKVA